MTVLAVFDFWGGSVHVVHMCTRMHQNRQKPAFFGFLVNMTLTLLGGSGSKVGCTNRVSRALEPPDPKPAKNLKKYIGHPPKPEKKVRIRTVFAQKRLEAILD